MKKQILNLAISVAVFTTNSAFGMDENKGDMPKGLTHQTPSISTEEKEPPRPFAVLASFKTVLHG